MDDRTRTIHCRQLRQFFSLHKMIILTGQGENRAKNSGYRAEGRGEIPQAQDGVHAQVGGGLLLYILPSEPYAEHHFVVAEG